MLEIRVEPPALGCRGAEEAAAASIASVSQQSLLLGVSAAHKYLGINAPVQSRFRGCLIGAASGITITDWRDYAPWWDVVGECQILNYRVGPALAQFQVLVRIT